MRASIGIGAVVAFAVASAGSGGASNGLEEVQNLTVTCDPHGGGFALAISPDGAHVYEHGVNGPDGRIFVSTRDALTGELTLVQSVHTGLASQGHAEIALSPDGEHLYVNTSFRNMLVYDRDPVSGMLTHVETDLGLGFGLPGLAVSPDGVHLYAVRTSNNLVGYERDGGTGALTEVTQLSGDYSGVAVSPDGVHVYATREAGAFADEVVVFGRDAVTGALTELSTASVDQDGSLVLSADGLNVYVDVPFTGVATFSRNVVTGALSQIDVEVPSDPGLSALVSTVELALSADDAQVYAITSGGDSVFVFDRSGVDGSLTLAEAHVDGVAGVDGLDGPRSIAPSPDGAHVYAIGEGTITFARDGITGALSFLDDREREGAGIGVVLSPDGSHAYRLCSRAVAIFDRSGGTGVLTESGNLLLGPTVDGANRFVMSPDGEHVYVGEQQQSHLLDGRLVVLDRDPGSGALSLVTEYEEATLGVDVRAFSLSPDGANLYLGSEDSLLVFTRNPTIGSLALLETHQAGVGGIPMGALSDQSDVIVSPEGTHVYVSTYDFLGTADGIAIFTRDAGTGALTFSDMVTVSGGGAGGLEGIYELVLSASGTVLHASGIFAAGQVGGIATYMRDPGTGTLTYRSSMREGAPGAETLDSPAGLDVHPDGTFVFAAGFQSLHVLRSDPATGALGFVETVPGSQFATVGAETGFALSPAGDHAYAVTPTGELTVLQQRAVCSAAPAVGCVAAETAVLKAIEKVGPSDLVVWKWKAAGSIAAGDPLATTEYALCLYDASVNPQPVMSAGIVPGGTCGTNPCWGTNAAGYKYVDKVGSPDGMTKIRLLTGTTGTAKIVAKGKGASLTPLALPYVTPVTVQMQASNGSCWEATYATPTLSDATQFKAKE